MSFRRLARMALFAAVVLAIALATVVAVKLLSGKTGGPVQVVSAPAEVVARGKYLAEAADCAACHSAPGGAPFAGGLAMQSGFGTIYDQYHARSRQWHRPVERRRFLAGAA